MKSMYMFKFIIFCGLFSYGFLGDVAPDILTESGVYVLTKDNFDKFIASNEVVLVEFYAPWCGHCKQLAPIYSDAAEQLKKNEPSIPLCKVDATVETELANRFGITGYPTMKFFKSGISYDYDEGRSASDIVNFMKTVSGPDWKPPTSHVLTLTKKNFTEIIEQSGYILVEFYAPWCGHCKNLAPEYAKAAKVLSKQNPPILLAAVDATAETELAKKYDVSGYPTIKLFRNKKVVDYNGPRYGDGIVEWMIKNKENAAKQINSVSELRKLKDPQAILLLGLFKNEEDLLFQTFIDATNHVRDDFKSVYSFNNEVRKFYKSDSNDEIGAILILREEHLANKFDSDVVKYRHENSNSTVDQIVTFIETNMFPIVAEYNFNTGPFLEKFNKDFLCIFFFTVDFSVHYRTATKKWLDKITKIAIDYKEKIQFAIADDERQSDKLRELRLDDSGEEFNVGCLHKRNIKYRMPTMEEFDSTHVREFINNILAGKVFPLLKSSPIPKNPLLSGIITVVGDTYKKLINDNNKEGLILLYRSPCEKCKNTRSVLSSMSTKLSDQPLEFFSMDLNQNDLPEINGLENVDSQPTIYFITENIDRDTKSLLRKKFIKFDGDQLNESDIKSFVRKNSNILKDEL